MSEDFVEGVYHEEKILTGGLKEEVKYWVKQDGDAIILEFLRLDGASTGMEAERLSFENFEKRFIKSLVEEKEPEKTPEERKREKLVREGELHLERKEFHSAEYEFGNVLKMDDKDVRANLGLGKTYVAQGRTEEAKEVFSKMTDIDDLYEDDNKHTLNEFGITLRREKMYGEAVKSYQRALEIDSKDPVLYYNLALALFHQDQIPSAKKNLDKALGLKADFDDAQKLMLLVEKKR